jgi:predicted Zn finger-like uncharacterized protein
MKFVCDRCHTRYSISDEKVKGKVLKIRCKTCGNIIVVREQGAESATAVGAEGRGAAPRTEVEMPRQAAGGGGGGMGRAPMAPSADNVEWFVAIKGKQQGPMTKDQLVEFFRQGRIHPRSYCWHEDLPGWTRMKDLPDFAAVIAQGQQAPAAAMPPPPPPDDNGAEVVDLQAHRQQRQQAEVPSAPVADPGAMGGHGDPFAAVGGVPPTGPSPMDSSAPRESTRVFIMNAGLHNRSKKHKTYAIVASTVFASLVGLMALDYAGIVRIPFLGDAALAIADYAGVEGAADKKKKRKLLAKWEDGDLDAEAACKFLGDCPQPTGTKRRGSRRTGGASGDGLSDDMFQTGGPGESGQIARGDIGPDGKPIDLSAGGGAASDAIRQKFSGDGREFTKIVDKKGGRDTPDIASSGGPDPAKMQKVVGRGMGGIKACIERAAKQGGSASGKQKLLLVIKNNGRVQQARILDGPTDASPLGECITRAARKWKFPPFGGDTFELVVPLVLTAN